MALGKGLSALIPDSMARLSEDSITRKVQDFPIQEIAVDRIENNRFQPRSYYNEDKLDELASSIREKGFIQPIVVRSSQNGYEVVAGERRLKAARKLGLARVPVIVRDVSDKEAMILALVENVQREELNAIEKAETYRRLVDDFSYSQEDIAKSVGKDRVTISNLLRLLKLPKDIQKGLIEGKISEGHARAILAIDDDNSKMLLFLETLQKGLSVREVEERSKSGSSVAKKRNKNTLKSRDPEIVKLEEELRGILGTKVSVENNRGNKGRMVVEYYSLNDLDRILEVIRK